MISVCIYCGHNKSKALAECEACAKTPESHTDVISSVVLCFSEDDPHLNFLTLEEVEAFRESIVSGSVMNIAPQTFRQAEEAYEAVGSLDSPQALQFFAKIPHSVMAIASLLFILFVIIGG